MRIERVVPWSRALAAGDARTTWTTRAGWLIVVEHDGVRGIGEASPLPGFGGDDAAAMRFALETAALDLRARQRGVPLASLLVTTPAARMMVNAVVADGAEAVAAMRRGVGTLKVKIGADLAAARARLGAIAAAAPRARLRADANQTWPLDEVEARLAALAELGLVYVEEPAAGLAATLRRRLPLPIALDESLAAPDREQWLDRALASGAVASLILKPTVLGGFAACAALAARAFAHGVDAIVTHALEGPVATAACCELARALVPNSAVGLDRHATLAAWPIRLPQHDGPTIVAAPSPGLGLDIDALLASV